MRRDVRSVTVGLRSTDAACLVAEALGYEFTAVNLDPLRPVARAFRTSDGGYRVYYARPQGGVFRPAANGYFLRHHPLADRSSITGGPIPASPIEPVQFVTTTPVRPLDGPREWIRAQVESAGPHRTRVCLEVVGPDIAWGRHRASRVFAVLELAARIERAMQSARNDEVDRAALDLESVGTDYRAGLSGIHDPLIAYAHALRARLLLAAGATKRARRATRRARLFAPDALSLALLEAQLNDRLARPEASRQSLALAADLAVPGTAGARAISYVQREVAKTLRRGDQLEAALDRSRRASRQRDWPAARNWANRALDLDPGNARALARLSDALRQLGDIEQARGARLMSLRDAKPDVESIAALVQTEVAAGNIEMGLRLILRNAKAHPGLLRHPLVATLGSRLGWERTLRVLRTEHCDPAAIRGAEAWLGSRRSLRLPPNFASGVRVRPFATPPR